MQQLILDFAKKEASKEDKTYLKSAIIDMIETLETWKVAKKTEVKTES